MGAIAPAGKLPGTGRMRSTLPGRGPVAVPLAPQASRAAAVETVPESTDWNPGAHGFAHSSIRGTMASEGGEVAMMTAQQYMQAEFDYSLAEARLQDPRRRFRDRYDRAYHAERASVDVHRG